MPRYRFRKELRWSKVCISTTLAFPTTHGPLQDAWTTSRVYRLPLEGVYDVYVNTDSVTLGEAKEIFIGMRIFELAKQVGTVQHYVWSGLGYTYEVCRCLVHRSNVMSFSCLSFCRRKQNIMHHIVALTAMTGAAAHVSHWMRSQRSTVSDTVHRYVMHGEWSSCQQVGTSGQRLELAVPRLDIHQGHGQACGLRAALDRRVGRSAG